MNAYETEARTRKALGLATAVQEYAKAAMGDATPAEVAKWARLGPVWDAATAGAPEHSAATKALAIAMLDANAEAAEAAAGTDPFAGL